MDRWWSDGSERGGVLWGGVIAIVATGAFLGLFQNVLVRAGDGDEGLAWKYVPPKLDKLEDLLPAGGGTSPTPAPVADPNDPLQMPTDLAGIEIPDVGRPIEITIKTARNLVDSKGAAIIDAREAADYAKGHLPGAVNLPFDEVITDPVRLEAFDPQGKPILVYCGGATCELSMKLGYELVRLGKKRVLVYTGGWPEWNDMKYPVVTGATPEGA
ncbi:MAG TPA: rhodanese-like domain-containing protein [Candidatus Polarisedimenticolaceae bacterium]|nr:rhodanese-like domain-containing protein [Candidatus Polarisedimenticolaceae bacterium]